MAAPIKVKNSKTQMDDEFHSISTKDGEFAQNTATLYKRQRARSKLAAVEGVVVAAFCAIAVVVGELPVVLLLFRRRWWRRSSGDEVDEVAGVPGRPELRFSRVVRHLPVVLVDGAADE
jgi:hypothetical protein